MPKGVYAGPRAKVSERANPLVKQLYAEMAARNMSQMEMGRRAGIPTQTMNGWAGKKLCSPNVANLEACFNVLGLTLQPIPVEAPE